jgi:hypothetical protein
MCSLDFSLQQRLTLNPESDTVRLVLGFRSCLRGDASFALILMKL